MARNRTELNLRTSIQTDAPAGTPVYDFNDAAAKVRQNTGIERGGGITALYQQETAHATSGSYYTVAKNGKVIELDPEPGGTYKPDQAYVKVDGKVIGKASRWGISKRLSIEGFDDVVMTETDTYVAVRYNPVAASGYIQFDVFEFDLDGVQLNTRTITFASAIPNNALPIRVAFVRWVNFTYAADLEFLIEVYSPGVGVILCRESGLTIDSTSISYEWGWKAPGDIFFWKFFNGYYFGGKMGNDANRLFLYDAAWAKTYIDGKWIVPQIHNDRTRFIVTKNAVINGTNIEIIGLIGYNDWSAFTATVTWETLNPSGTPTTINGYEIGYGYALARWQEGAADIYEHGTTQDITRLVGAVVATVNTDTVRDLFGNLNALNKTLGATHDNQLAYRVCRIAGRQSYLSVAWVPSAAGASAGVPDNTMGVMLTEVGGFDEGFLPQVKRDETSILYKHKRSFVLVKFAYLTSGADIFQEIAPNVHKINTITPLNIIDADTETLEVGSIDFAGWFRTDTSSAATASHRFALKLEGKYCSSIDRGEVLITCDESILYAIGASGAAKPHGWEMPFADVPTGIEIDFYYDGEYSRSIKINGGISTSVTAYVHTEKSALIYVASSLLPVPMGSVYTNKVAQGVDRIYFLAQDYIDPNGDNHIRDAYPVGADLFGSWTTFGLFGQTYGFDGSNIYLFLFNGNLFSEREFVAPATGMTYVASSPTRIFFRSSFDNSIYVFNGGRELLKLERLNNLEAMTDGVFNVRDNTLVLQTANTIIWVRDDIVTLNSKLATQTATRLFDTTAGAVVLNDSYKWIYSYEALSGSTVAPLTWQSPYLGRKRGMVSVVPEWHVALYNPAPTAAVTVTLTCESFDEDEYASNAKSWTIQPKDWTSRGFVRLRIQPKTQRALASSLKIETSSRLVITGVAVEWEEETPARPRASRSL